MLELEDVQHYLLTRPHATIAQYNFITFRTADGGRKWINALSDIVGTAKSDGNKRRYMKWVSLAFTGNGLRKLGVDDASLATFPEPFRPGMAESFITCAGFCLRIVLAIGFLMLFKTKLI